MTVQSVDEGKIKWTGNIIKEAFQKQHLEFHTLHLNFQVSHIHLKFQVSHIILEIQVSHIAFERENASLEVLSFLLPSLILVLRDE